MAVQKRFATWFKGYCKNGGSVRDFLYGQISDTSKECQGFRVRFNYSQTPLTDLNSEAKAWTAESQDVREDAFFDSQMDSEMAAYDYYIGLDCDLVPNIWDEIETKLERSQLLPT